MCQKATFETSHCIPSKYKYFHEHFVKDCSLSFTNRSNSVNQPRVSFYSNIKYICFISYSYLTKSCHLLKFLYLQDNLNFIVFIIEDILNTCLRVCRILATSLYTISVVSSIFLRHIFCISRYTDETRQVETCL